MLKLGNGWREGGRRISVLGLLAALVALSSGDIRAQAPAGDIPSINAKVTSLRFFEGPPAPHVVPRERRKYGHRFERSNTRLIFWELNLTHPASARRIHYTIEAEWFSPSALNQGKRIRTQAFVQLNWTWSYWTDGAQITSFWKTIKKTGQVYRKEELWAVGPYRVNIYVGGTKVASGAFEIIDGKPSADDSSSSTAADRDKKAAEAAYKEAHQLTDQLKFREAIPQLDKAIRLDPELLSAYALRGYSYNGVGNLENRPEYRRRAIEDYTTAIQKSLKSGVRRPGLYNSRGGVYMGLNENQRALQDYNEAIKMDPKYVTAISNRGELRRHMGDLDGSIADLTRVIQLEPKVGARYCQRGLTWLRKAQEVEGENDFRRCAELDPKTRQEYTKYINKIREEQRRKP
jgi:tetratricopeptide (TPR) repeat protein